MRLNSYPTYDLGLIIQGIMTRVDRGAARGCMRDRGARISPDSSLSQ